MIEGEANVLADAVDRARGEGDREDGLEPIDGAVAPLTRNLHLGGSKWARVITKFFLCTMRREDRD